MPPPRSLTIVGSAVETMVWSSADSSIPSMIATTTALRAVRPVSVGTSVVPTIVPPVWTVAG
ncbi:hypothetical protein ACFQ1S_23280 [Kibdelosporangium lantanae]|uniref:Uncharacterized protein n=1 Tax=Kibdelosporangium lantanae TaxID=1497396 RepID=A0ABW3MGS9_9PSEU